MRIDAKQQASPLPVTRLAVQTKSIELKSRLTGHFHGWLSFSRVEPAGVLMREPMLHKKGTHFCRHLPSDFGIYGGL